MAAPARADGLVPLLDPAGYSGRNLAMSPIALGALNAWCLLKLARLGLQHGRIDDTRLTVALIEAQACLSVPIIARRLARDCVGLRAAVAVAVALDPTPSDRRAILIPLA